MVSLEARIFHAEYNPQYRDEISSIVERLALGQVVLYAATTDEALGFMPQEIRNKKINMAIIGGGPPLSRPLSGVVRALNGYFPDMLKLGHRSGQFYGIDYYLELERGKTLSEKLARLINQYSQKNFSNKD